MNKFLVISGGSRGIGLATISLFLQQGYQVVNLSRKQPPLEGIHHLGVDMSSIDWVDTVTPQLQALLGDADQVVLVHNAAVLEKDSVREIDAARFQRVLQLNVVAASQLNGALLPQLKPGSSILYVNSTLGEQAVANTCSYVVSKHAQLGLMKTTCQDLFGSGIHTAAICPGFTDTEMLRDHVGNEQEILDYFSQQNAFGRLLEPKEIAETIWFCSQNPAINGSIIHANLGQKQY